MNHHVHARLMRGYDIHLTDGIDPPFVFIEKALSKGMRMFGLRGLYAGFSARRLDNIAASVHARTDGSAALDFYHGATSWLHVRRSRPYACYLDACFATYMNVYQDSGAFSRRQIAELSSKEARFLSGAVAVFFSSEWALRDCVSRYGIPDAHMHVAGLGGGFPGSGDGTPAVRPHFLFIGHDFKGKGGDTVMEAFMRLKGLHPQIRMVVAGQRPPEAYLETDGVEYVGVIDKSKPQGLARMRELFQTATCFVLPTSKDMTPLVLIEAASLGCPVISTRSYGIPEIVDDGITGLLVDPGAGMADRVFACMERMLTEPGLRSGMGAAASLHARQHLTWEQAGGRIFDTLAACGFASGHAA